MDFNADSIRYILRCQFTERSDKEERRGLDRVLSCEYMGAAEYEFGAIPASHDRILKSNTVKVYITIREKPLILLIKEEFLQKIDVIVDVIKVLADKNKYYTHNLKMGCHLHGYFEPKTVERLKKGCKHKTETVRNFEAGDTNCWWDITNDWVLYPAEYEAIVDDALKHKTKIHNFFKAIASKVSIWK